MPIPKHFGGSGAKVMSNMKKEYGAKDEDLFYATETKMKKKKHNAFKAGLEHGKIGKKGK